MFWNIGGLGEFGEVRTDDSMNEEERKGDENGKWEKRRSKWRLKRSQGKWKCG